MTGRVTCKACGVAVPDWCWIYDAGGCAVAISCLRCALVARVCVCMGCAAPAVAGDAEAFSPAGGWSILLHEGQAIGVACDACGPALRAELGALTIDPAT